MYSVEECRNFLLNDCKITIKENKYIGNRSTGFFVTLIPNLMESIKFHTSFLPENRKNKERYYCILKGIDSLDKIPKCHCDKLCNFLTLEREYSVACSKEHSLKSIISNMKEKLKDYKVDFSNIEDKSKVISFFKERIDVPRTSIKVIYENINMFNSLFYHTQDLILIEYEKIFNKKILDERIYLLFNDLQSIPLCVNCGKHKRRFNSLSKGYYDYCSKNCGNTHKVIKTKKTNNERYGGNAPTCSKDVLKKRDENYFNKTGYYNPQQNPEVRKKSEQTCLEKYGANNVFQSEWKMNEVWEKYFEKTGHKMPGCNPNTYEKASETYFEKTGYYNPLSDPSIQNKCKQTLLKRYGVSNPVQNPDTKEKIKQTCLEKYGVICGLFANGWSRYSKVSQELFNAIYEKLSIELKSECYYATCKTENHNKEFAKMDKEHNTFYFYDFTLSHKKIIIEFDGSYWHSKEGAKERDEQKQKFIEDLGFKVLRIDELNYYSNKNLEIEKCMDFIKGALSE